MTKKFNGALAVAATTAMAVSMLAGCGSKTAAPAATNAAPAATETKADAAATETEAAATESTGKTDLKFISVQEPQNLFPGSESQSAGHTIQCNIYDTLVSWENTDPNTMIPKLATSWEYSNEGKTITFEIREGVKFHDGSEMTVDDVVFSLKTCAEGSYNADAASLLESIEKVDDHHVAVTTKYAYKPFLQVLGMPSFGIFSQAWYEKCQADGTNIARAEMGTGPYIFDEWQSGDYLTMHAFEDYWEGAPAIKTFTMKFMADGQTAALAMQAGEADMMTGLDSADADTMRATPGIVVEDIKSNGTHFLALNCQDKYWLGQNKDARKAIQYALNREEINLGGLDGTGTVTPYPVNPGHFGYDPDWQPTPFDLDKAKELLAGTGYDGTAITYKAANSSWYQNPAQVMTEEMRKAGFNIDLQIMERGAWEDDVDAKGNSEIWNYMTWGQFPDADADLWMYLHSSQIDIDFGNLIHAGNAEVDAALEGGRYSVVDEERMDYYRTVADINEEEAWYAFIMTGNNFFVRTDEVKGFAPHSAQFYHFTDWSF